MPLQVLAALERQLWGAVSPYAFALAWFAQRQACASLTPAARSIALPLGHSCLHLGSIEINIGGAAVLWAFSTT